MAKISTSNLNNTLKSQVDAGVTANAAVNNLTQNLTPKISAVSVANISFSILDDTAVNVGGGYIVVTGENFTANATVLIDTTQASAVTRVNTTTLHVQVPAKAAATYNLYVVNPDGGTGIRVNAITYSSEPFWVTTSPLANQNANTFFGVNLSATGATSYSVAAGSTLPAGTTLAANGYFSGTVTIGAQTTYSFGVVATDAELQDSPRTFQVTVTVTPQVRLYTFGKNNFGQLGLNNTINTSSPVQVGTDTTWSKIINLGSGSSAIKTDGTLWSWGFNNVGQLGVNDRIYRSSPTQVGASTTWLNIFSGTYNIFATKTDGTLWSWGDGSAGTLGLGDMNSRSSPTQVGTGTNWNLVFCTNYSSLATKTDGTLWRWGNNSYGELGDGTSSIVLSPTQSGFSNWSTIGAGQNHFVIIKTDGTMWSCGRNFLGGLGLGDTVDRSTFSQIGSSSDWSKLNIGRGGLHSAAIKTDGTLWLWGNNLYAQLGLNNTTNQYTPAKVGTNTNWNNIYLSRWSTIATTTSNNVFVWGRNISGQLGLGDAVNKSSPTQLSTTGTWTVIYASSDHTSILQSQ